MLTDQRHTRTGIQDDHRQPRSIDTLHTTNITLPLPAQFAPGPLHTHHNGLPGQYVMSSHPSPSQNHPSQLPVYYGCHPIEFGLYAPSGYCLPGYQPLPYFHHHSSMQDRNLSYQQAQCLPSPMPKSATDSPGPSRAGSYGTRQYLPLPTSTGHFGLPQQYQPNVYQWYHGPGPPADTVNKGVPMQVQQHYPMNYSPLRTQRLCRDSTRLAAQPTGSEHLPSPSPDPSGKPFATTASRNASSPAVDPPERTSVQSSDKIDTHEPRHRSAASPSCTHDRPLVRRHYHPNPPPKRSEWVMWVGNVASDATYDELWQFLTYSAPLSPCSEHSSRDEDSGVISIFLISRSNCAFVNYQSEEHLNHAIAQLNGRKLRPHDHRCPRFVCRARRKEDDLRAGVGAQRGIGVHTQYIKNVLQQGNESAVEKTVSSKGRRSSLSTIYDPPPAPSMSKGEEQLKSDGVEGRYLTVPTRSGSYASTTSSLLARDFPKRFFILKSLTQYALDLSVKRGVWATQKHNEAILDQAFRTSKEVILIFSVNRSSGFYGYALMADGIPRSNYSSPWAPRADSSPSTSSPSPSCVLAHDIPGQRESPSRQSPQTYTSPSARKSIEAFPFPPAPSSDEPESSLGAAGSPQVESAQERRSAPPVLDCDSEVPISPPRSSFSCSDKGWPVIAQVPQHPDSPSTLRPGVCTGVRSKGGDVDEPGNPELHLQLVTEDVQPASTAISSVAMHGHAEVQQGVERWGKTFKVEWLCTERVPFHRTRHLRNPWNHDREIKVSRDGTELEPVVGQQLIEEWATLASEAGDNDAKRTAGGAGRRAAKPIATPGPSGISRGAKKEPS